MHLILLRDLFSIVLAGLMVLIVVYAVSIARLTRWTINADRDPVPLDPLANPFPGGIGEHFDQVQADLQTEGFEPVADYALPDLVANGAAFARMFVNRAQQDVARGTAICIKHPMVGWKLRRTSCQFETSFSDGTGLMTTNSLAPRMLPPPPEFRGSIRVDVRDVARLRRIHQKVVERLANGRSKEFVLETRFTGDALRYHAWVAGVPNAFNLRCGYYCRVERTGGLRLTLKGAIVAAVYLLPPGRQVLARQRARRAKRLLRELDV
jgi:hypothetical protein